MLTAAVSTWTTSRPIVFTIVPAIWVPAAVVNMAETCVMAATPSSLTAMSVPPSVVPD